MRLSHRYRSISVLWFTTCSSLAWAAQWLISLRYQQREHFVCSAPLPFQHQSIILFNFQLIEFIGKKSELLQLPLLPGKERREGKIKIPGNCTTVRSSPSVASRRQPSVRGILPLPVGKHSTLKMHFFPPGLLIYFELSFSHHLIVLFQRFKRISDCFILSLE